MVVSLKLRYCLVFIGLLSCISYDSDYQSNIVKIRIEKFPSSVNYLTSNSTIGGIIQRKTFNRLLAYGQNLKYEPLAVMSLPKITHEDSILRLEFELRPEFRWDDGSSVTSKDIEFSLKAFKLPLQANALAAQYYSRFRNVIADSTNKRKFTITAVGNKDSILGLSGDFAILQKSVFDPNGWIDNISFNDIIRYPDRVRKDSLAIKFIEKFISDPFKFNGEFFRSSGQYEIDTIEDGRYIALMRNKNWWGLSLTGDFDFINEGPGQIIYYSMPENLNAIQYLKNGDIDVMSNISTHEFILLQKSKIFQENYGLYTPINYRFSYIGINSRNPVLSNKKIRKALAHLLNKKEIIKTVENNYAESTTGPINPVLSYYYNNGISPYKYNPVLSEQLLLESGELIKIDGRWCMKNTVSPIEFNILYRQGSQSSLLAQILRSEAQKIGIGFKLTAYDGRTLRKKLDQRDFDIFISSLKGSPFSFNFSDLFGVDAQRFGGMNRTGFGNAKSDSLIQAVNFAKDSVERRDALFGLQEMLHDEATMLFLYFSKNKIAISKKFTNLKISSLKPGYDVTAFELVDN